MPNPSGAGQARAGICVTGVTDQILGGTSIIQKIEMWTCLISGLFNIGAITLAILSLVFMYGNVQISVELTYLIHTLNLCLAVQILVISIPVILAHGHAYFRLYTRLDWLEVLSALVHCSLAVYEFVEVVKGRHVSIPVHWFALAIVVVGCVLTTLKAISLVCVYLEDETNDANVNNNVNAVPNVSAASDGNNNLEVPLLRSAE